MRWDPYVPVWKRKANGLKKAQRAIGKGKTLQPIQVQGRKIGKTFWGNSWCTHLEDYSDFANRLPRGRTYARNGSIVHLEISSGKITAMVAGRDLYRINIKIDKMSPKVWRQLCNQCASSITSTIDLLSGKLPESILEMLTDPGNALFPDSREIHLACDCPDWADLCKHSAAVLYGVGNRLDDSPELLFKLRGVDLNDLIGDALIEATDAKVALPGAEQLGLSDELGDIFGIELIDNPQPEKKNSPQASRPKKKVAKKKKATKKKQPTKKRVAKKKATPKKSVQKKTVKKPAKKKATRKTAVKKKSKSKQTPAAKPLKKSSKKKSASSNARGNKRGRK